MRKGKEVKEKQERGEEKRGGGWQNSLSFFFFLVSFTRKNAPVEKGIT